MTGDTVKNFDYVDGEQAGIKMWTRGVPVEDQAMQQLRNVAALPFIQVNESAARNACRQQSEPHAAEVGDVPRDVLWRGADGRTAIGRQVDASLERIAELEGELLSTPARTAADVAVLLPRIYAANERGDGMAIGRMVANAMLAVD